MSRKDFKPALELCARVVRKGLLLDTKAGGFFQRFLHLSLNGLDGPHLGMAKYCRSQICVEDDGHLELNLSIGIPSSRMKECLDDMRKLRVMLKSQQALPSAFMDESEDPSEWTISSSL